MIPVERRKASKTADGCEGKCAMRSPLLIISIAVAAIGPAGALAQTTQTPDAQQLTFDVVAIHPSPPESAGGGIMPLPNGSGYTARNMSAKMMMAVMYRIPARQIEGGPEWFDSERFDVEARAERGGYSMDELHTMFKNLLRDRFGLKIHIDTREGPVYVLTVDKGGLKMKDDGPTGDLSVPITQRGPGQRVGTKVPMEYLCWRLGQALEGDLRPVVDQTGLKDVYDFELTFLPILALGASPDELPPELRDRLPLRDALEGQLGLALKPAKGPVPYYVVDQVEKPSAN
jgi:uncharacterized protein (TIGR03435 family)